ncbi:MAG: sensor histidine kinase, partial [Bacteroidota bacterium]
NPHFLFNSLNTLVNIIPEDTEKATLFTQRLAAVYRRILEYRHKELIPLTEELAALQDYVFLMQTRFEDKLRVEWCIVENGAGTQVQCEDEIAVSTIPHYLRHHRIVPLSVQLLVENAIKHNVISSEHPLVIRITLDDDCITVCNQLRLRERKLTSTGWGHENLRERYRAITQEEVLIEATDDTYTVRLPILSARAAHGVLTASAVG